MALAENVENEGHQDNEFGIMFGHSYPILESEPKKKAMLKNNYGEINGFEYNDIEKTFMMNVEDLHHNFPFAVICKFNMQ